jgi:hypothetical protein
MKRKKIKNDLTKIYMKTFLLKLKKWNYMKLKKSSK